MVANRRSFSVRHHRRRISAGDIRRKRLQGLGRHRHGYVDAAPCCVVRGGAFAHLPVGRSVLSLRARSAAPADLSDRRCLGGGNRARRRPHDTPCMGNAERDRSAVCIGLGRAGIRQRRAGVAMLESRGMLDSLAPSQLALARIAGGQPHGRRRRFLVLVATTDAAGKPSRHRDRRGIRHESAASFRLAGLCRRHRHRADGGATPCQGACYRIGGVRFLRLDPHRIPFDAGHSRGIRRLCRAGLARPKSTSSRQAGNLDELGGVRRRAGVLANDARRQHID